MANILISQVKWNYVSQRWFRIHYVTEKSSHWSYVEQQLKARFKEKDDDFPHDEHHDFAENDLVNFHNIFLTLQENSIALTQQMGQGIQEWLSKNCGRQPLKKIQLGPFLNTLTQVLPTINCYSTKSSKMEDWRFSKDFRSKYNNMNDNLNNNLMSENIRQKRLTTLVNISKYTFVIIITLQIYALKYS